MLQYKIEKKDYTTNFSCKKCINQIVKNGLISSCLTILSLEILHDQITSKNYVEKNKIFATKF